MWTKHKETPNTNIQSDKDYKSNQDTRNMELQSLIFSGRNASGCGKILKAASQDTKCEVNYRNGVKSDFKDIFKKHYTLYKNFDKSDYKIGIMESH